MAENNFNLIREKSHFNPHSLLGFHKLDSGESIIRIYEPEAKSISVTSLNNPRTRRKLYPAKENGFWETKTLKKFNPLFKVHIRYKNESYYHYVDPYQFLPTISDNDLNLFKSGDHRFIYEQLGAHLRSVHSQKGVRFAVWAPSAKSVSVLGDFNYWNGYKHQMRSLGSSGIWEIFIPGLKQGLKYKFEIKTQNNDILIKTDPYASYYELRPNNASIVFQSHYKWKDSTYIQERKKHNSFKLPMNIYELHLGSWMRNETGHWLSYRELAPKLIHYLKEMHYTHVEFMPVMEYPFDGSWGYQVTGYYAPTSRFGNPDDFRYLIDQCHQNNISVILDWVPAHFPKDDFALAQFDGTALYEHDDPRKGEHPDWGTYIFNFGRKEVKNFLIANAVYWLKEFHIDGLRIDAVASMLYLDYSRKEGEWLPNIHGGNENLDAIDFFKHLNSVIKEYFPEALIIAEESTSFGGVTKSIQQEGLGFDYKWNMGWMNDYLRYMSKDPIYRKHHHNDLTFSMVYAYSENFIQVLSHDEVVHGKASLLAKMPGDDWQKFANYKLLLFFMFMHPGKKLNFMGYELATWNEWNENTGMEWFLLQWELHQTAQNFNRDLNEYYLSEPALWQKDTDPNGFQWIDVSNEEQSIISFIRRGESPEDDLIIIANFTPQNYTSFRQGVPFPGEYEEIFNTDLKSYMGTGRYSNSMVSSKKLPWQNQPHSFTISIPPLAGIILKKKS